MKQTTRWAALHYRDFRLLWGSQFLSIVGSQMTFTAVNWHVFNLLKGETQVVLGVSLDTGALGLGTLGLVRILPILFFALIGGAMADSRDRRKVMTVTQSISAMCSFVLAGLALTGHDSLYAIYALTAAIAAAGAFDNPSRQALLPNLVPKVHLTNAISLGTLSWQLASIVGPTLAGVLLARTNVGIIYALDGFSFLVVMVAVLVMDYRSPLLSSNAGGIGLSAIREGIKFTFSTPIIASTMLLDFFATFFSSARTMLPIVASDILKTSVEGYGLLATAQAAGAVLAGTVVALRGEMRRQGWVLLISVIIYGVATALFGLTTNFALAYLFFALTGAADTVSTVIRGTIRQLSTPDHLRGRMIGVNMIFFMGGPQLGELEAGLVAAALGVPFAIVSGGIATVVLTLWVAWRYRVLRQYSS